jgi:hypothetical protein
VCILNFTFWIGDFVVQASELSLAYAQVLRMSHINYLISARMQRIQESQVIYILCTSANTSRFQRSMHYGFFLWLSERIHLSWAADGIGLERMIISEGSDK